MRRSAKRDSTCELPICANASVHSISRLALRGQRRDGVAVLLAQVAVDLEEALEQPLGRAGVDLQVRRVRRDGRHDAIEERLIDRDLRLDELLDERLVLERRRRLVAGGIAGEGA